MRAKRWRMSDRKDKERCKVGKPIYTKKEAQRICNIRNWNGAGVRIYYCKFCNYFHLTHREYIDKNIDYEN